MASRGPSGRISPDEFVERLKEIVAANAAESTQLVTRFSSFVRKASRAVGAGRAGEGPDGEALLSRFLDFNLASYSVVNAQGLALLNGLLFAAESTLIPKAQPAPDTPATPSPRVELQLAGRHGERATTDFMIENHFDRPLALTFEPADLVPSAGASLPASCVSFEPTTLEIGPRGRGVVQAAVTITTDFVVGQTYTTTVRLLGFEGKEVGLSVTVLPADAAAPSGPSPKPGKSAKKRRSRATKLSADAAAPSGPSSKPRKSAKKRRSRATK